MNADADLGTPDGAHDEPRPPSLWDAIGAIVALMVLLIASLVFFGMDALDGPVQVALILACAVVAAIALKNGWRWEHVQSAGAGALSSVTSAIFILFAVGALIGTWNMAGTIPTLVYYGIQILAPSYFYVATALVCGIVAMSIGSSWTTAGTIGVGLVGIAGLMGVSVAITAGAVISGAYLGDKLSPLSETTVLTAQLTKVDLYTHVRNQAWTSVPAFVIACIVFAILGMVGPEAHPPASETVELAGLSEVFWVTPLTLLPLLILVIMSVRKWPPSLALLISALSAAILAPFLQPDAVREFTAMFDGSDNVVIGSIQAGWQAMATGFQAESGVGDIDRLVSRGGMYGMLVTIWLILGAVTFGALMEKFGLISRIVDPAIAAAKSRGRLWLTVFLTGFGLNIIAGDQYIALVLPARIYRTEFIKRGLAPQNLSRLCADSATVTSPLIPWNSCGAFMAAVLGVATLSYLPFAVFCLASPLLSLLYGFTGFRIVKLTPDEQARLLADSSAPGDELPRRAH